MMAERLRTSTGSGDRRTLVRHLLPCAGILLLVLLLVTPYERGRLLCSICGVLQERHRVWSVTVSRTRFPPGLYARWFQETVDLEHEHDWRFVGCFRDGPWTMPRIALPWLHQTPGLFRLLPRIEDQEAAREAVGVLLSLNSRARRRQLANSWPRRGPLDGPLTDDEYAAWLDDHPIWCGVLPAELELRGGVERPR